MHSAIGKVVIFGLPAIVALYFVATAWADRRRLGRAAPMPFFRRNGIAIGVYLIAAVGLWTVFTIVLPQLYMVDYSFRPKLPVAQMGGPKDLYTLDNYHYFLFGSTRSSAEWNVVHIRALYQTVLISIVITAVNFAICYPIAFYMAQVARPARVRLLMLMLIAPYWVNEILRAFAFRILLGTNGIINRVLVEAGVLGEPVDFLGADVGLYAGLSYAYLLLMMFPVYNAIENLDRNQIEAARDLGAPWWHIHLFIVMPHAKPGIASGATLVFMLNAGALAAPLVLGGPRSLWFTPIVYDRFYQAFNWQQGAAYALILLLTCVVFVLGVLKLFRLKLGEIAR